jgi:hypothetical protein
MTWHFLNVDLQVHSRTKPDALLADLGNDVTILNYGPAVSGTGFFVSLELARSHPDVDSTVRGFCKLLTRLSPRGKRIWATSRRVFDVGFELSPEYRGETYVFSNRTLAMVAGVGGTLAVTCYPEE